MLLILKLLLIITINKTYVYSIQDSDIILLPAWNPAGIKEMSLTFKVFGKLMQLNMHRNSQIVSSVYEEWKNKTIDVTEKLSELKASNSCFYENCFCSAIINISQEHGLKGFVFVENNVLEIRPLQNVFKNLFFIDNFCVKEQMNLSFGRPHFVKRSKYFANSDSYHLHKIATKRSYKDDKILTAPEKFIIELAVFVDIEIYNFFTKYTFLENNIDPIDMMLTYVKQLQNFFHHPSLGNVSVEFSLVRLDFMEDSFNLLTYSNDSLVMLNTFCEFASNLNPLGYNDPRHCNISLYITGKNIFDIENVINEGERMLDNGTIPDILSEYTPSTGKTFYDRACEPHNSCAVAKVSLEKLKSIITDDSYKYFFASSKFQELSEYKEFIESSLSAAQQIAHFCVIKVKKKQLLLKRLGVKFDSEEECVNEYIMCKKNTHKPYEQAKWSPFSNTIKSGLQRRCFLESTKLQNAYYDGHMWPIYTLDNLTCDYILYYPGREQTAKVQCERFLHNKDANVVTLLNICKNLQCEKPHSNTSFFIGYALNGTYCAPRKECCGGQCMPIYHHIPPYINNSYEKDSWSEWERDSCKSSCLEKSKGILIKRRSCEHRGQKTPNCTGAYYDVDLCDDSSLCADIRTTIAEFTINKCIEYVKFAKRANMSVELLIASGYQMPYDAEKLWVACTVFCRQKEEPNWYAPRQEILDHDFDPYFPDGTWCYNDEVQDYYCRQHQCVSENYFIHNRKKVE